MEGVPAAAWLGVFSDWALTEGEALVRESLARAGEGFD